MNKRPDFSKMSTRETLEYLFDEQEQKAQKKEQLYEWQSEKNACDECAKYDGQLFSLDNVPITHPNCKCKLVAKIDDKKEKVSAAELSKKKYEERKTASHKITEMGLLDIPNSFLKLQNKVNETINKINPFELGKKVYDVASDMIENYIDMRYDNTEGNDNYFHCKANFNAAKRGSVEAAIAEVANVGKELFDFPKNLVRGISVDDAIKDFKHDIEVDHYGLFRGLRAQENETAREACRRYLVNGINPRY